MISTLRRQVTKFFEYFKASETKLSDHFKVSGSYLYRIKMAIEVNAC